MTLEREGGISVVEGVQRIADHGRVLSQRVATSAGELSKLNDSHRVNVAFRVA